MSDFDDELLDLVEGGSPEKKRKRSKKEKGSSSKRRKADESDGEEPESEDLEDLYPLEGKYHDEADRKRLMEMSEFEREEILAQRMEELQRQKDKRAISQMVNAQRSELDGVAKAAKRQHTARGSTKEKTRKLDELKARRKAKDEKTRNRGSGNSPKRDRSESPMDVETSDEDEEDGMITRLEQEEEREAKLLGKPSSSALDNEPITMQDLENIRLTRIHMARHFMAPWFPEYVKGAWVRYLIPPDNKNTETVYRICEIKGLVDSKPYKIEGVPCDKHAQLQHGSAIRTFPLDRVSNAKFDEREFDRLRRTYDAEKVKLPTRAQVERKRAELGKYETKSLTESELNDILAKKETLTNHKSASWVTYQRSRLTQERTLAQRRQDYKEVEEIDRKLAEFDALHGSGDAISTPNHDNIDVLSKLSEKNRKANAEAIRRAEIMEAERRRRERKLALAGKSGTSTPTDPSARLRTIPRTFNVATPTSRPTTPAPGTPSKGSSSEAVNAASTNAPTGKSFEASVIQSIEVDLGDF